MFLSNLLVYLPLIQVLAVVVILFGILGILASLMNKKDQAFPYRKKLSVMTSAEQAFFRKLEAQYGDQYYIFPQINLDKLFEIDSTKGYTFRNKIDRKSVDFVLVDRISLKTEKAIELDDITHKKIKRIQRDKYVEQLFAECGLRLERVLN